MFKQRANAQTLVEYTIIIGIAAMAIYFMAPALKRGTQSVIKAAADQMAAQQNAEQDFSSSSTNSFTNSETHNARQTGENYKGYKSTVDDLTNSAVQTVTVGG